MNYKILIYFIFLSAVWGASFMFMKVGVPELGAYAFGGLRVVIAGLVLLPLLMQPKRLAEYKANWVKLSFIGVLSTGIPFMLFSFAAYQINASVLSVVNASVPIMTGLIAHFLFKDYLNKQQFFGLIIGFSGVALLVSGGFQEGNVAWWAFASALGACLFYSLSSNLAKRHLSEISPMTTASSGLLASAILMLPIVVLNFPHQEVSLAAWTAVFAVAILSTSVAMVVFYNILQAIGPTKTAAVTLLVPLFGIFWGVLLLGEPLSLDLLVGAVVILSGTALTIFFRKK